VLDPNMRLVLSLNVLAPAFLLAQSLFAQSPAAFTYQGRLNDAAAPANGIYDFAFALFPASSGGINAGVITNAGVAVSNGLFTVLLDFGSSALDWTNRWLEISVQPSGGKGFFTLTPRQFLAAAPYAATAATVIGPVPANQLTGTLSSALFASTVSWTNPANIFSGNAVGLTNVQGRSVSGVRWLLNVKEFGAKGDGVTDDTSAIQAALDAASGGSSSHPKIVFFPFTPTAHPYLTGGYVISAPLVITNNGVVLEGEWRGHIPGGSLIRQTTPGDVLQISAAANGVEIRYLFFSGNGENSSTGACIRVLGVTSDLFLHHLVLCNAYDGIFANSIVNAEFSNIDFWQLQKCIETKSDYGYNRITFDSLDLDEDYSGAWLGSGWYNLNQCKMGAPNGPPTDMMTNSIVATGNTFILMNGCVINQGGGAYQVYHPGPGSLTVINCQFENDYGPYGPITNTIPIVLGSVPTQLINCHFSLPSWTTNYVYVTWTGETNQCFATPLDLPAAYAPQITNPLIYFPISKGGAPAGAQLSAANTWSGFQSFNAGASVSGNLSVSGMNSANYFSGNGGGLTNIALGNIAGFPGAALTTNIVFVNSGGQTNTLQYVNGVLTGVVPQ
jgi:hypothetical protein